MFAKNEDIKKYPNREHALCILNHRGDVDWMVGWCLIERIGMLGVSPCHYLITVSALFSSIYFPPSCKVVKTIVVAQSEVYIIIACYELFGTVKI